MSEMHEVDTHEFHVFAEPRRWAVRHFRVRGLEAPTRHFFIVHDGDKLHDQSRTHAFQGEYPEGTLSSKLDSVYDKEFSASVTEKLHELMHK